MYVFFEIVNLATQWTITVKIFLLLGHFIDEAYFIFKIYLIVVQSTFN